MADDSKKGMIISIICLICCCILCSASAGTGYYGYGQGWFAALGFDGSSSSSSSPASGSGSGSASAGAGTNTSVANASPTTNTANTTTANVTTSTATATPTTVGNVAGLIQVANTNYCLQVAGNGNQFSSGTAVNIYDCSNAKNPLYANNYYWNYNPTTGMINNSANPRSCLNINNSFANGTAVTIADCGYASQSQYANNFLWAYNSGDMTMRATASGSSPGSCLNASPASIGAYKNGTPVNLWTCSANSGDWKNDVQWNIVSGSN